MYTDFLLYYPTNVTKYTPTYPHSDLLHAVINCGIIPLTVRMECSKDGGAFVEVPAEIRQEAADFWQGGIITL